MAAWWQSPVTQKYNPPIEPGVDLGTPFRTPITALLPGTVVGESYGGFGARVDIKTAGGPDIYYQHLDEIVSGLKVGSTVRAGQEIGLSGGQLYGGSRPNSPLNSTGPHMEVGIVGGGNPGTLIAAGPQLGPMAVQGGTGIGSAGGGPPPTPNANPQATPGAGGTGSMFNINFPDPIASLQSWVGGSVGGVTSAIKANIIPLVVAAVIIVIVLGTGGSQQQQSKPQIVPVPV